MQVGLTRGSDETMPLDEAYIPTLIHDGREYQQFALDSLHYFEPMDDVRPSSSTPTARRRKVERTADEAAARDDADQQPSQRSDAGAEQQTAPAPAEQAEEDSRVGGWHRRLGHRSCQGISGLRGMDDLAAAIMS